MGQFSNNFKITKRSLYWHYKPLHVIVLVNFLLQDALVQVQGKVVSVQITQHCYVCTAARDIQGNAGMSGISRSLPCPLSPSFSLSLSLSLCLTHNFAHFTFLLEKPTHSSFTQHSGLTMRTTCLCGILKLIKLNFTQLLLTVSTHSNSPLIKILNILLGLKTQMGVLTRNE